MKTTRAVVCCLFVAAAAGQAQQMRQPVLGWIFDGRSGRIRAIAGVSGSAIVDQPLAVEPQFRFAAIAPGRNLAIAESDESTALVRWDSGAASVATLEDALRDLDGVVYSPSGRAAVLRSGKQIQLWVGLHESPSRIADMEDAADVIAVSDEGTLAMAREGVVNVLETTGDRLVYEGGNVTALAFRPLSGDLAIADEQRGEVQLASSGFTRVLVAADRPSSMAFSADGDKLGITAAESAMLVSVRTGETQTVACSCGGNAIARMQGNAVFRLGTATKGAIRFLDGDALEPRLFTAPQMGERQ